MSQSFSSSGQYEGEEQLIFSFDIGTLQSSVSFTYLFPGCEINHRVVDVWPFSSGGSSIPSAVPSVLVYETRTRSCVAGGFEAQRDEKISQGIEEGELVRVINFTSLVKPKMTSSRLLPLGLTVKDCYRDWLQYLFKHTKRYMQEKIPDADNLLAHFANRFCIIISHPLSWSFHEQCLILSALEAAEIFLISEAKDRVKFITDIEATLHFMIDQEPLNMVWEWEKVSTENCKVVVNAGDDHMEVCAYQLMETTPKLAIHEASVTTTLHGGSISISRTMESHLSAKLKGTEFGEPQEIKLLIERFNERILLNFRNPEDQMHIPCGSRREQLPKVGIVNGRLKLSGKELEEVFDPTIMAIVREVKDLEKMLKRKNLKIRDVYLSGMLGNSPYLRNKLHEVFDQQNVPIRHVEGDYRTTVVIGAAVSALENVVNARRTRFDYGYTLGDEEKPNGGTFSGPAGEKGNWNQIVSKGTLLKTSELLVLPFTVPCSVPPSSQPSFSLTLLSHTGSFTVTERLPNGQLVEYCYDAQGVLLEGFEEICTLWIHGSDLLRAGKVRRDGKGLEFEIGVRLGGSRLSATLIWDDAVRLS